MTRKRKTETDLIVSAAGAAAPARRKAAPRTRANRPGDAVETQAIPAVEPQTVVAAVTEVVIEPTHEEIAALAFTFWAGRGYQGGSPEEDWLRAEQELRMRASAAVA